MPGRLILDHDALSSAPLPGDLSAHPDPTLPTGTVITLAGPANWTGVIFFAILGLLHLGNAVPAFINHRWEGYMSMTLACAFIATAVVMTRVRPTLSFDPGQRRIRISNGIGRFQYRRDILFDDVHAVRLTLLPKSDFPGARIEVLCDNEDIHCPASTAPREDALCLAVLLGVQLIKVFPTGVADNSVGAGPRAPV